MREIKFKIWLNGKMRVPGDSTIEAIYFDEIPWNEKTDGTLLQYTGCIDSNGKEIYEGDIVKDTWKENRPYGYRPDEWDDTEEVFVVKYHGCSFNLTNTYGGHQTCIEEFNRVVIGNIYENPELL